MKYDLVFDSVILKQLKKIERKNDIKTIISKMLDKIEILGENAGELIDSKLFLYEMKSKSPSIRLYFKINKLTNEAYVFEFEMKKSQDKQQSTIDNLKRRIN